jgi:hypothetical protein
MTAARRLSGAAAIASTTNPMQAITRDRGMWPVALRMKADWARRKIAGPPKKRTAC